MDCEMSVVVVFESCAEQSNKQSETYDSSHKLRQLFIFNKSSKRASKQPLPNQLISKQSMYQEEHLFSARTYLGEPDLMRPQAIKVRKPF